MSQFEFDCQQDVQKVSEIWIWIKNQIRRLRPTASEFQIIDLNTNIKVQFERLETADFHHGKLFKNRSAFFLWMNCVKFVFVYQNITKSNANVSGCLFPLFLANIFLRLNDSYIQDHLKTFSLNFKAFFQDTVLPFQT